MSIRKTYIIDVEGNAIEKMDALEKQAKKTAGSIEGANKKLEDTGTSAKKASAGLEDVSKNGGAIALLDSVTGGMATKMRDAFEATKLFNFSLKGMRTALISTGIGALVVAAGLLVAYWDDIVGFITGANKALENQQKLIENTQDLLDGDAKILDAQEKLLISQGKSIVEIRKERIKIAELQIQETKNQIANLKLQLDKEQSVGRELGLWESIWLGTKQALGIDTSHAVAARIAEQEAREIEIQSKIDDAESKAINLETFINGLKADPDGKGVTKPGEKKETEAEKTARIKKETLKKQNEKDADDALKAEDDRLKTLEDIKKEYAERERDQDAKTEIDRINLEEQRALEEIDRLKGTEEQKQAIRNYYRDERKVAQDEADTTAKEKQAEIDKDKIDSEQAAADAKVEIQNAALDVALQGIDVLKTLFEDNKAVMAALLIAENAAGIARIVINTAAANAKAVAAFPLTGGQPWVGINTISAGIGIAGSIAATAKGLSALGKGGDTGGGAKVPGGSGKPSYSIVGDVKATSGGQQATTNAVGDVNKEPIKAYVVSTEVTSQQAIDRQVENNSSI